MTPKDYAFKILNNLSRNGVGRLNLIKLKQSSIMECALIALKVPEDQWPAVAKEIESAIDNFWAD